MCSTCRTTKVVTIATPRNTPVATSERNEKRAIPHTPWPLVQPPASEVPYPTSKPASTSKALGNVVRTATGAPGGGCSSAG
jgi:hypothetical protein